MRIVILLLLIALTGCTPFGTAGNSLNLQQVLDAFQREGLRLDPAQSNPDNIFEQGINGVKPSFYRLADGTVYIYKFKSEKARIKGLEDFYNRPVTLVLNRPFEINNVLILYVYGMHPDNGIDDRIRAAIQKLE
ncbi:hypothetical protein [Cohnella yongneupensis]|uniref:Lipoprotein n=1 Tax=Cohnella yongneupensis TaxID=425006 RepID=A0ABW0R198_9BACL